jgi:hypothetical protein
LAVAARLELIVTKSYRAYKPSIAAKLVGGGGSRGRRSGGTWGERRRVVNRMRHSRRLLVGLAVVVAVGITAAVASAAVNIHNVSFTDNGLTLTATASCPV